MVSNLIYDVGMHNGDDTAYYLFLGYEVVAIDASPELVAEAKIRFSEYLDKSRLEILNIGIASKDSTIDFYLNKTNSVWNSFDKRTGTRGGGGFEIIEVKTKSIDHVLIEKGTPYYMKIDIEGNDIFCLTSLLNCEEKPSYISAELSDIELIHALRKLGYTKFKIVDQASLLPLEIPFSKQFEAYETHKAFQHSMNLITRIVRKIFGRYINNFLGNRYKHVFSYKHPFGSSGPFAENLSGKWLNFEEAITVYCFYKSYYSNKVNNPDFWADIHAN